MGKLFVISVFAITACYFTMRWFPGVGSHAFFLGNFSVSYLMLAAIGYLYVGHKLTGK